VKRLVLILAILVSLIAVWSGTQGDPVDQVSQAEVPQPVKLGTPSVYLQGDSGHGVRTSLPQSPLIQESSGVPMTGTLIVRVIDGNGSRIGDVLITLGPANSPSYYGLREGRTGDDGTIRFDGLSPGPWLAAAMVGGSQVQTIKAGVVQEVEIIVPPGSYTVSGQVVDWNGRPIEAAVVWTAIPFAPRNRHTMSRTDALGQFSFRTTRKSMTLGAYAEGFAPSKRVHLEISIKGGVILELPSLGAILEGAVEIPIGVDANDILVMVGWGEIPGAPYPELTTYVQTRLDQNGGFRLEGLPAGVLHIGVGDGKSATWSDSIEVLENETKWLNVVLLGGVTVEGFVLNAAGRGIKAYVTCAGPVDGLLAWVVSDADGRFLIPGVRRGSALLQVFDSEGYGELRLQATSDPTIGAEIRVSQIGSIRGLLRSTEGQELKGWFVELTGRGHIGSTESKVDGSFEFGGVSLGVCKVSVRRDQHSPVIACIRNLRPGMEQLVITINLDEIKACRISGVIADASERRLPGSEVSFKMLDAELSQGSTHLTADSFGTFEMEGMVPGKYEIRVSSEGYPEQRVCLLELQSGVSQNLGVLTVEDGGILRINLVTEDSGLDESEFYGREIYVRWGYQGFARFRVSQPFRIEDILLPSGSHLVKWNWVDNLGISPMYEIGEVRIGNGEIVDVEVQLRAQ
jgi:hypothetical protein